MQPVNLNHQVVLIEQPHDGTTAVPLAVGVPSQPSRRRDANPALAAGLPSVRPPVTPAPAAPAVVAPGARVQTPLWASRAATAFGTTGALSASVAATLAALTATEGVQDHWSLEGQSVRTARFFAAGGLSIASGVCFGIAANLATTRQTVAAVPPTGPQALGDADATTAVPAPRRNIPILRAELELGGLAGTAPAPTAEATTPVTNPSVVLDIRPTETGA